VQRRTAAGVEGQWAVFVDQGDNREIAVEVASVIKYDILYEIDVTGNQL